MKIVYIFTASILFINLLALLLGGDNYPLEFRRSIILALVISLLCRLENKYQKES